MFLNHRKYTYTGTFSKLQISFIFAKFAKLEQKIKNTCEKFTTLLFKIRVLQFFWKPQNKGFYIQKDFFALNGGTFSLTMHTPTTKQNRVLFIYIRYLSILPYSASMLNIVRRKWMKITLKGNFKGNIKKDSLGHKSGDYGVFHFVKKLRMFTKSLHILIQASVLEMFCVY